MDLKSVLKTRKGIILAAAIVVVLLIAIAGVVYSICNRGTKETRGTAYE